MMVRIARLARIEHVMVKYALEELFLENTAAHPLRHLFLLSPTRWMNSETRALPRGQRIRLALEELGPVFVKLGQALSTRRDLLPDDIGDELTLLQDNVKPFASELARIEIERALNEKVEVLFQSFEDQPIASASVAQVHGAVMHDGSEVIVKVLRPGISETIRRDVSLMYLLADIAAATLRDGKRLRPREVVAEYDKTIHDELDLVAEATNAVVLRNNFKDSDTLYIPEIHWDYTRSSVMVQERISGIPIRDIKAMEAIGMDMKKLAEHGVEIFYTQVFDHNFFHADMHPGNIFVSREHPDNPQYIAVDFGIVGSLTDEDQRYMGENLLAFFQRDYRRVAQLHIDSGWVPRGTRVSELEAGVRAVCEPIFEKPLAEISLGDVLLQLFNIARRFDMEVQPQLVLLQKTLLNIEGLGRQLYPDLDLWATGKPFLKRWVVKRNNPQTILRRFVDQAPQMLKAMPELPMMVHDHVDLQNQLLRRELASGSVKRAPGTGWRQGADTADRGLRYSITGAAIVLSAALLGSANVMAGSDTVPWWVLLTALLGAAFLMAGLRRR
ncbi:ubiquinone biosynthesis regulatory protein kinase UbiB [Granulosicoccus sp. 3-233]|uniref:ubiquinone biosynthesis regulatory protein kinase UbiB n=1 Tax=Granulosicoccus sp. 3-233 TaxID=3417969 RepID=UPI003D32686A